MTSRTFGVFVVLTVAGCSVPSRPTDAQGGYKGIQRIQILAKGME